MDDSKLRITIIHGKAGTGKSTYICSLAIDYLKQSKSRNSVIIVCPTHFAVDNIKSKLSEMNNVSIPSRTLHSYFRINPETLNTLGPSEHYEMVIIDEISMIDIDLYIKIISLLTFNNITKRVVLCGDLLQLPPITVELDHITLPNVLVEDFINLPLIRSIGTQGSALDDIKPSLGDYMLAMKHLSRTITCSNVFNSDHYEIDMVHLTENKRSNDYVNGLVNSLFVDGVDVLTIDNLFIDDNELIDLVINHGYIIIAGAWSDLEMIDEKIMKSIPSTLTNDHPLGNGDTYNIRQYDKRSKRNIAMEVNGVTHNGLRNLRIRDGMYVRSIITNDNFVNGELLRINGIDMTNSTIGVVKVNSTNRTYIIEPIVVKGDKFVKQYPFVPAHMLTVHRSQGMSIDNIVVCVDNMFEPTMLYTAITRARNDVKLYQLNKHHYNDPVHYNTFRLIERYLQSKFEK